MEVTLSAVNALNTEVFDLHHLLSCDGYRYRMLTDTPVCAALGSKSEAETIK